MSCSNAGVQGQQRGSSILLCRWHDKWSKSILPLLGSHWIERNEGLFYLTCPLPAQARRWRWAKTTGLLAGYYNQSAKRLAQGLQIFWPWLLSSRIFRPLLFLFGLALILDNFLGYLHSFYLDIWLLWILHTCFFVYKEYFLFSSWSKLWYLDFACSYNVLYTMQCCYTTIISYMQLLCKNSEKGVGQCSQCRAISILCFNFYEGVNHSYLPQW